MSNIQASERARPWVRMGPGLSFRGHSEVASEMGPQLMCVTTHLLNEATHQIKDDSPRGRLRST